MENNTTSSLSTSQFPGPTVLIRNAASFAYKNFWKLLVLMIVPVVAIVLIEVSFFLLQRSLFGSLSDLSALSDPRSMTVSLLLGVLILFIECIFGGSIISYIVKKEGGQTASIVDAWRAGFLNCWPLFCATFILQMCLITTGLLLVIPAIILAFYACLYPFAVIADGHRDFDALVASYVAVRGSWWRTFGYYMALVLMFFACEIMLGLALSILTSFLGLFSILFHATSLILYIGIGILLAAIAVGALVFVITISIHYFYSYYQSLKLRKAGAFESEFNSVRSSARKVFIALAIIGFVLITVFYSSGLYGRYMNFIESFEARQMHPVMLNGNKASFDADATDTPLLDQSAVPNGAAASAQATSSLKGLYVSKEGHFQIELPTGWSLDSSTSSPDYGIDLMTAFRSPDGQASIVVTKIGMPYERRTAPDSSDTDISKSLAQQMVAAVEGQFNSVGLLGFQASNLSTQAFGPDMAYVHRGSASSGSPKYNTWDFKSFTIFNSNHGYEILGEWPESKYGWNATTLMESFATFKAN